MFGEQTVRPVKNGLNRITKSVQQDTSHFRRHRTRKALETQTLRNGVFTTVRETLLVSLGCPRFVDLLKCCFTSSK